MTHWSIRAKGDNGMMELSHQGKVDEIFIGSWFHLEQMDRLLVCIRVGDVGLMVQPRPARRPVINVSRGSDARGTTSVCPPVYAAMPSPRVQDFHSVQAAISRLRAGASPQRLFILPAQGIVDRASFLAALSQLLAPTEPPAADWPAMRRRLAVAIDACGTTELVLIWPSAFELYSRDADAYRIARGMFEEAFALAGAEGSKVLICTGRDDGPLGRARPSLGRWNRLIGPSSHESRARGAYQAQLTTDLRRPETRRFYERLGFVASHAGMKIVLSPA